MDWVTSGWIHLIDSNLLFLYHKMMYSISIWIFFNEYQVYIKWWNAWTWKEYFLSTQYWSNHHHRNEGIFTEFFHFVGIINKETKIHVSHHQLPPRIVLICWAIKKPPTIYIFRCELSISTGTIWIYFFSKSINFLLRNSRWNTSIWNSNKCIRSKLNQTTLLGYSHLCVSGKHQTNRLAIKKENHTTAGQIAKKIRRKRRRRRLSEIRPTKNFGKCKKARWHKSRNALGQIRLISFWWKSKHSDQFNYLIIYSPQVFFKEQKQIANSWNIEEWCFPLNISWCWKTGNWRKSKYFH